MATDPQRVALVESAARVERIERAKRVAAVQTGEPQVIIDSLDSLVGAVASFVAEAVANQLKNTTPRLTGLASASWIVSVGTPTTRIGGILHSDGKDSTVNTTPQIEGLARLNSYELKQGQIFISNLLPYILRLNSGSSTKAPSGFVEMSIEKGMNELESTLGGRL